MKIISKAKIRVLAKVETKSADGKTSYFKLTVMQGVEAGQLKCSEEVYNRVRDNEEYTFNIEINDAYDNYYKLVDIEDNNTNRATTPPTGATK